MMKKIWNARKDSEGVSPVIATILMVAITVVLAAILMVMVMGMTDSGTTTPTIAQINVDPAAADATSLKVTVVSIVPSAEVGKVTFTLNDAATGITKTAWDNPAAKSVISGSVATLTVSALVAGTLTVKILVDGVVAGQKSIIVS